MWASRCILNQFLYLFIQTISKLNSIVGILQLHPLTPRPRVNPFPARPESIRAQVKSENTTCTCSIVGERVKISETRFILSYSTKVKHALCSYKVQTYVKSSEKKKIFLQIKHITSWVRLVCVYVLAYIPGESIYVRLAFAFVVMTKKQSHIAK